jgi:hypothetical protein
MTGRLTLTSQGRLTLIDETLEVYLQVTTNKGEEVEDQDIAPPLGSCVNGSPGRAGVTRPVCPTIRPGLGQQRTWGNRSPNLFWT